MNQELTTRQPFRLSVEELRRSRAGTLGRFPSPDLYELEEDEQSYDTRSIGTGERTRVDEKTLSTEAPADLWDSLYEQDRTPWRSAGLSDTARRLLACYAPGPKLLEVGCGVGSDAESIVAEGFQYLGLDISRSSVRQAEAAHSTQHTHFACADFFHWSADASFDVLFEKGVFHGLGGLQRRNRFVRRVARLMRPNGVWISVCGSADQRRKDSSHGAIYLRDLVSPAEVYFEVLEVVKAPYGLADKNREFDAWHTAFRLRNE